MLERGKDIVVVLVMGICVLYVIGLMTSGYWCGLLGGCDGSDLRIAKVMSAGFISTGACGIIIVVAGAAGRLFRDWWSSAAKRPPG